MLKKLSNQELEELIPTIDDQELKTKMKLNVNREKWLSWLEANPDKQCRGTYRLIEYKYKKLWNVIPVPFTKYEEQNVCAIGAIHEISDFEMSSSDLGITSLGKSKIMTMNDLDEKTFGEIAHEIRTNPHLYYEEYENATQ